MSVDIEVEYSVALYEHLIINEQLIITKEAWIMCSKFSSKRCELIESWVNLKTCKKQYQLYMT